MTIEDKNINDISKDIYDKTVTCPVCGNVFKTKVVKVNSPRINSKDSDFFIRYTGINPYLYEIWTCNECGYSALKSDFPKIKSFQKDLVKNVITPKWKPRIYPEIMTVDIAIEKYKLALLNAVTYEGKKSSIGMLLLKIAWMYRLKEDTKNENNYLDEALKTLSEAYSVENFPICGLSRDAFTYLLGDLNRRLGNNSDALRWYSQVITTVGATPRIKDLARNGRDLIKESSYS
ncbi:MAG: DUF2225 domain-containing protein [Clostridiales bacterium]|nr:DUF2225 domain-containing protein [Clostridiales bacterium]